MKRVPEVIDCWFDSGSMPFAQHHYPFENKEVFEQQFPAKFISEAVDQTRGWFYSLLAISTLLFNKAPYENVIVLGHVQDADGQKMSKSKGNAVDPFDALKKHGADAIRWYFYENSKMSDPEVKANLIANNKTINWIPETIGTGRFGAWLENVQDWGISRNRYWGTPLNIWVCDDCVSTHLSLFTKKRGENPHNCDFLLVFTYYKLLKYCFSSSQPQAQPSHH